MRQWQCTAPRWCSSNDGWSKKKKPQWRQKPPRRCRRSSGGAVQATKWRPSMSEVCEMVGGVRDGGRCAGFARSCAGRRRRWRIAEVRRCKTKKWGFLTLQRVSTASCSSWTEAYCLTTASVKKEPRHIASIKKKIKLWVNAVVKIFFLPRLV